MLKPRRASGMVLLFQPQFEEPILAGRKAQTIRPVRMRPPRVGQQLSLRVWTGQAYRSKQREFARRECLAVMRVTIDQGGVGFDGRAKLTRKRDLDAFARRDGFESWREMRAFFNSRFEGYELPFEGTLICFAEA